VNLDVSMPTICPCQDFLLLLKDADADIPILIAAKSEYVPLQ